MRPRLDHLEEQAELYALGMLGSDDNVRVNEHVRTCRECAQRVGRAEGAVAAMTDATLARETAPRALLARVPAAVQFSERKAGSQRVWHSATTWATAAAAVFAFSTVSLLTQNAALHANITSDDSVFGAMVHSHFSHVQFTSPNGTPIDAKVVYERHGGWYEILAVGIDANARIAIVRNGVVTQAPERWNASGTAFTMSLPALGAVDELRLVDAQGRLLGRARPVLAAQAR